MSFSFFCISGIACIKIDKGNQQDTQFIQLQKGESILMEVGDYHEITNENDEDLVLFYFGVLTNSIKK